jgi:protoporphyrinogen oxidase
MKDYRASLGKLRKESAENKLISDLATGNAKRKMFAKLAKGLDKLADEVERAIALKKIDEDY